MWTSLKAAAQPTTAAVVFLFALNIFTSLPTSPGRNRQHCTGAGRVARCPLGLDQAQSPCPTRAPLPLFPESRACSRLQCGRAAATCARETRAQVSRRLAPPGGRGPHGTAVKEGDVCRQQTAGISARLSSCVLPATWRNHPHPAEGSGWSHVIPSSLMSQ